MQDYIRDYLMQIVAANGMSIISCFIALVGCVIALGIIKKLGCAFLAASLNAGETAARKLTERPRAVMLALSFFSLAVIGLWAWHTFSAPKIVEKPVIQRVTVKDEAAEAAVTEIREQYGKVESAKSKAEERAVAAERRVESLKQARKEEAQAREQAEAQVVSLSAQIRELSPPEGDEKALERLLHEIDALHADGVAREAAMINAPVTFTQGITSGLITGITKIIAISCSISTAALCSVRSSITSVAPYATRTSRHG